MQSPEKLKEKYFSWVKKTYEFSRASFIKNQPYETEKSLLKSKNEPLSLVFHLGWQAVGENHCGVWETRINFFLLMNLVSKWEVLEWEF